METGLSRLPPPPRFLSEHKHLRHPRNTLIPQKFNPSHCGHSDRTDQVATIRKRGVRWQAQVRLQGHRAITKSFTHRADTEAWARQQEVAIERGEIQSARRSLKTFVLADLLARYQSEVTPKKRGAASELFRLRTLKAAPIATLPLDKLTPSVLARHRRAFACRIGSFRQARTRHIATLSSGGAEGLGRASVA